MLTHRVPGPPFPTRPKKQWTKNRGHITNVKTLRFAAQTFIAPALLSFLEFATNIALEMLRASQDSNIVPVGLS